MTFVTIIVIVAFGEFLGLILLMKIANDLSKKINTLQQVNQSLIEKIEVLQQQLEIATTPVTADEAYAGFRDANKEKSDE